MSVPEGREFCGKIVIIFDIYGHRSSGRALGDKVLALAVLAAVGVGYLSLSKISIREAADGNTALGRGLRRRLQDAVGPTGDHTEEGPTGARIGRRKIRTEEPMAGYGR